jgi:hypothetical protein
MKIAFDLNGVIRDVFTKTAQVYTKFYLEDREEEEVNEYNDETDSWDTISGDSRFKHEINLPVTSMNLINHFKFEKSEDLYDFFYVDFPMQIFGHSTYVSGTTFNILNDYYVDLRDEHEIYIISDEIGKSKPATLFFLSKYGSLIENIKFYSKTTLLNTFNEFDIIITSNPDFLSLKDKSKKIIKVKTTYNTDFDSDYDVKDISELSEVFKKLNLIEHV